MTTISALELASELRPVLLRLGRALRQEARELGITGGQATLLAAIKVNPELGVRELAAMEGISAPAMSRYVDRLQAAGCLTRERDPDDGRRVRLTLTPKGLRILRSLRNRRTAWLATRLAALSDEERATVEAAVEPLLRLTTELR